MFLESQILRHYIEPFWDGHEVIFFVSTRRGKKKFTFLRNIT